MTATLTPAIGIKLPLLFTFRDTLFGNGFVVEVKAQNGRALCVHEQDGFWMYGVNPGGMSASGDDLDAVGVAFRVAFSSVLKDLALEANSFREFQDLVRAFFEETNQGYEPEWLEAVAVVRNNQTVIAGMPTVAADSPRSITIEVKMVVKPEDNVADLEYARAA